MSLDLTLLCCSVGRSSVVSILETLEYLEKSFTQNLAALFWMASILFIVWGSQTGDGLKLLWCLPMIESVY